MQRTTLKAENGAVQNCKAEIISNSTAASTGQVSPSPDSTWVFTDLDGTLLDHDNYGWHAANDALALLQRLSVPLVLNTSKTWAEVTVLQAELAPGMPVIVENGAAVLVPMSCDLVAENAEFSPSGEHYAKVFGINRSDILSALKPFKSKYQFVGFSDLSVDELVDFTKLQPAQAMLALQRDYSEPLIWRDSAANLKRLTGSLNSLGFSVTQGGRFVHIAGRTDKGRAMRWLANAAHQIPKHLIALGDSENDRPMLEQSDWPVVIATPAHDPLVIAHPRAIITKLHGPKGWNSAIQSLFNNNG